MPGSIDIRVPSAFYQDGFSPMYSYGYNVKKQTIDLENPADPIWEDKNDVIYCTFHIPDMQQSSLVLQHLTEAFYCFSFCRERCRWERWQQPERSLRLSCTTPTRPDREPVLRPHRPFRKTDRKGGRDRPRVGRRPSDDRSRHCLHQDPPVRDIPRQVRAKGQGLPRRGRIASKRSVRLQAHL